MLLPRAQEEIRKLGLLQNEAKQELPLTETQMDQTLRSRPRLITRAKGWMLWGAREPICGTAFCPKLGIFLHVPVISASGTIPDSRLEKSLSTRSLQNG